MLFKISKRCHKLSAFIILIFLILNTLGCTLVSYVTGLPYNIRNKTVTEYVGSVKNSSDEEFQLKEERKVKLYERGDGGGMDHIWTRYDLIRKQPTEQIIKSWVFEEPLSGKIFLTENKNNLIVIFENDTKTKIFIIRDANEQIQEISDLKDAMHDQDKIVRYYATRGFALNLLPEFSKPILFTSKSKEVERIKSELGELTSFVMFQLLSDDYDRYWMRNIDQMAPFPHTYSISERAASLVIGLNMEPQDTVELILKAWKRDTERIPINEGVYWLVMQNYGRSALPYLSKHEGENDKLYGLVSFCKKNIKP